MKSWNEIRKDATRFAKEWENAYDEKSQAQSFLKDLLGVFGVNANKQATFESRIKLLDGSQGYIDLLWKGVLLVEMKSAGKDLNAAFEQAKGYTQTLPPAEVPRAILCCDFQRFELHDLTNDGRVIKFKLSQLRRYVKAFAVLFNIGDGSPLEQDPVNREAAECMAHLHDALKDIGYTGRSLEVYLCRLLFCLFAEDAHIFDDDQFTTYIRTRTNADGSDLAQHLESIFYILDTPPERRLKILEESLAKFPYVNGGLFRDRLPLAAFTPKMRESLIRCGDMDWVNISPAIFGSMFQGVMDDDLRRALGAHYTSEENILKVIRPLFLDRLRDEFTQVCALQGPARRARLMAFHDKIASLTFFDPACGCGNFLIIAYREIRQLESDILDALYGDSADQYLDITSLLKVSVDQFYGIELEEFPAEIARVALWLVDQLENLKIADRFGQYFARIPIKATAHIVCGNALTTDWSTLQPKNVDGTPRPYSFIFGNPPFVGAMYMSREQKAEMLQVFQGLKMAGELDYVCAWYKKAADLIQGTNTRCAFVSTNSISQGQQVSPLWSSVSAKIDFAYRTFKWTNEARGMAAVHCVIIGFSAVGVKEKFIFKGDSKIKAKNINGYLVDATSVIIDNRGKPICDVPPMNFGNMPRDGGNLIIEAEEYDNFIKEEPQALPLIRPLLGAVEFLHGKKRYCLWLVNASPALIKNCPKVRERIEACRQMRLDSKAAATRKFAATPGLFCQITQPEGKDYIAIPRVSSERRDYIPIGFLTANTIVTDLLQIIPDATLYHFGILTSRMHNAWMRAVAGRLKSDYRYSKDLVYNNFIWPTPTESQKANIEQAAQKILDVRSRYLDSDETCSLADLYDPDLMPPDLTQAHVKLDSLVDKAYGHSFVDDAERVSHLFELYAEAAKDDSK